MEGDPVAAKEPHQPLPMLQEQRIPSLDGLRGLAAVMVLIGHCSALAIEQSLWFWLPFSFSWLGVELFFVLSGFLITAILLEQLGKAHYFTNFYGRRLLRTVPLYYVLQTLLVFVLPPLVLNSEMLGLVAGWRHRAPWYYAFMANALAFRYGDFPHDPLDITWSLSVEEQFYAFWPLVIILITRGEALKRLGWLLLAVVGLRVTLVFHGWSPHEINMFTPARLDSLVIGGMIAVLRQRGRLTVDLKKKCKWIMVGAAILWCVIRAPDSPLHPYTEWLEPFDVTRRALYYPLMGVFFGGLIVLCITSSQSWFVRMLESRVFVTLGLWSYGIFLTHNSINYLLQSYRLSERLVGAGSAAPFVHIFLTLIFSILSAALCHYVIEKPFLRLKRYLPLASSGS
jgi:peptidoglycan/LPS O-acetylase OafA/YrhL